MTSPSKHILAGSRDYSLYVCENRALPSVADGMKSGQRIALWTMRNVSGKIKTAALSGKMVESGLYVHGDAGGLISYMAAPYLNNYSLLTGRGAFGTLSAPHSIGAPRYTSVSTSKFSKDVVLKDKDLYQMVPSVDGDNEICKNFLPLVPLVLLNGVSGMAVGYSTEILPHKYSDVKNAVTAVLKGKKIRKMKPFWTKYDLDIEEVYNEKETSASFSVSGKVKIINTSTVEITSIPPSQDIEKLQAHLDKLVDAGKIVNYDNNTSDKFSIVIAMKRAELNGKTENDLVKLFKLTRRITERLVCVDFSGKAVRVFNDVDELIREWTAWRLSFYKKRYEFLLNDINAEISFYENILKCFKAELPAQLSGFKTKKELEQAVNSICGMYEPAIVEFASYKWTIEYREKIEQKLKDAEKMRVEYRAYYNSDDMLKSKFIEELEDS